MPVRILNIEDVPTEKVRGASVKLVINPADEGVEKTMLSLGVFEPGEALIPHSHDLSEEIYLCLEGEGMFYHGSELTGVPLKPGTVVFVPPHTLHSTKNTGNKKMVVAFFCSPGTDTGSFLARMKAKGVDIKDRWIKPQAAEKI